MKHIDLSSFQDEALLAKRPYHDKYLAMYSSIYGAITTDPLLMVVPVDDHMVHRGDGVFDTFKCVKGNIYNMRAHILRLERSSSGLYHEMNRTVEDIENIIIETVRTANVSDCSIRVYLSRGPGSFDVNPYDCPEPQLYVVVTTLKAPFMDRHPEGATVKTSMVSQKDPFYATMKSCNYLVNVLMRKEAVDAGVDFVAAFDEQGYLTEGATENFAVVTNENVLLFPRVDRILRGTTMIRVKELADQLLADGDVSAIDFADITVEDVKRASEMLVLGTTPNVAMVREFDAEKIGNGLAGPVFQKLSGLLLNDIYNNAELLTPVINVDRE